MASFLLAWELGANLGHATRLRSIAIGLKARGHRVTFAVRNVAGCRHHLGADLGRTLQAPLFFDGAAVTAWTLADVLLNCGYADSAALGALVDAWRSTFELSGCDALVADHAPTALLAARAACLPALHVGHGFSIPPRVSPLPVFRDWVAAPTDQAASADAQALGNVNAVLDVARAPRLAALCDLFYPEQTLLCTWPELDHCAGLGRVAADYRGPDCEVAPGAAPAWPPTGGPRVFAYLRGAHPEHAEVLKALGELGCPTVCFIPDAPANGAALPRPAHIHYSPQPLDMRAALDGCSLIICHAGQASVAQALRAGIPCLLLPLQSEQFLLARQLERAGACVNAATLPRPVDYRAVISELSRPDGPFALAAKALAQRYRQFDPAALTAEIVAEAELLAG